MAHMNRPIRRREWRTVGLSTSTRHNNRKNFRVDDGNHIQPSSNRKKQSILSKSNRNNQLKIISPIKKIRFKKPKSKSSYNNIRNPFQRHQLSDESRWLVSRLT